MIKSGSAVQNHNQKSRRDLRKIGLSGGEPRKGEIWRLYDQVWRHGHKRWFIFHISGSSVNLDRFVPPANEVLGKVIFSQASVCPWEVNGRHPPGRHPLGQTLPPPRDGHRVPTFPDWQNSLTFPWFFQYFLPFFQYCFNVLFFNWKFNPFYQKNAQFI